MDFGFSETQEMFRRTVRDFAKREFAPGAKERAKLDHLPKEVIKKLGDAGLLGVNVPEKYGGQPADWISVGILLEELSKVDAYVTHPIIGAIGAHLTLSHGSEELRQEWLPAFIRGDKTLCLAVTEPDCGSDAAAIKTRALRDGDHYVITGEKTAITRGMHTDVALLWAKTDPKAGARGVSCFLVPLDLPGITKEPIRHTGFKPLAAASITLDGVHVPTRYRVGEEGKGFFMVMGSFDLFRAFLSLNILAVAQVSLEETIDYAKQRTAFGQPIAKYQGVSFKIAESATLIEAARFLAYRALWLRDQELPHSKESAMCKWFSTQIATQVIHDCIIIHGHLGYSEEYPLEQRLRDALGFEIFEGPPQLQKMIIARELLGKEFA